MNQNRNDPDLNFKTFIDHGIYTIAELNELSKVVKPHFNAIHVNSRSLNAHFNELCDLLQNIPFVFDAVGCSESWLTDGSNLDFFHITGYNIITDNRTSSYGGGAMLYLKSEYSYTIRSDLKINQEENLWVETKELIIGVIYNPPTSSTHEKKNFIDKLEETLHKVFLSKKKCLIMGDFNINTLSKNKITKDYLNVIYSEGFNPLIFEATRINETSQSCIDHIHTNFVNSCTSGSIAYEIADHLPIFCIVYDPQNNPFPEKIEIRDFKGFKQSQFRSELSQVNWKPVFNSRDVDESLSRFSHLFNKISNNLAPLTSINIRSSTKKPWITIGLKESIKTRDKLYKKWLMTRKSCYLVRYKLYRNKIVAINKYYRDLYYNDVLANSNDMKKTWDNINMIINKTRPSSQIDKLSINHKQIQHPYTISNTLNSYFCNIPIVVPLLHKYQNLNVGFGLT